MTHQRVIKVLEELHRAHQEYIDMVEEAARLCVDHPGELARLITDEESEAANGAEILIQQFAHASENEQMDPGVREELVSQLAEIGRQVFAKKFGFRLTPAPAGKIRRIRFVSETKLQWEIVDEGDGEMEAVVTEKGLANAEFKLISRSQVRAPTS